MHFTENTHTTTASLVQYYNNVTTTEKFSSRQRCSS